MNPRCRLTILFDCCHSGSAVELPYLFRPDAEGRVSIINEVKEGLSLAKEASGLLQGGFSMKKVEWPMRISWRTGATRARMFGCSVAALMIRLLLIRACKALR